MKPKLLIVPSWYVTPQDRINGSFFQAQGQLVSDIFDTRVLYVRTRVRPSLRNTIKSPLVSAAAWWRFSRSRQGRIALPDENIFKTPELHYFEEKVTVWRRQPESESRISSWLSCAAKMIDAGWRPDLVRAHTSFPAGIVARRLKSMFGIPYVISEHMPFSLSDFDPKLRHEIKLAFKEADLVLSLSYDKVRQLAMSGIDIEPNIVFNMVDEELFAGLAMGYSPKQPLRLVTVGAASFYKDHKTLLRSIRLLVDENISLHLTMIGLNVWGGDTLNETRQLIKTLKLENHITVIDSMSRQQIAEALPKFDIFMMTSIQEGFPNSVLEALASGLFVVATRHGGTEDLLTEEMGRVVPVRDHVQIAKVVSDYYNGSIVSDPSHIRKLVVNVCGRQAYKSRLTRHYHSVLSLNHSHGIRDGAADGVSMV